MDKFAPMFGTNMRSPDPQYSKFPVILVHVLFWAAFLFLPLLFFDTYSERTRFLRFWGYQIILSAIYYYLNYYILIPKILFRKKVVPYILVLFGAMVLMMVITWLYRDLLHYLGIYKHAQTSFDWKAVYIPVFPCVLAFGISSFVRMTVKWMESDRSHQDLLNEKLAAELGFLKSQVNPHFLFNTLNNICSLARKKSDETENALIKLSDIMRYMLDDSREDRVFLTKEIQYLNNYIELQRLRLTQDIRVDFTITGDPNLLMIEPMLLIPFVENAFKHGIGHGNEPVIVITLIVAPDRLQFDVENRIFKSDNAHLPAEPGMGLKNVKRRLELLYPGKHELRITDEGDRFRAVLVIRLK